MISELVSLNTLRMNQWNLTKLCICVIIDKDWIGIARHLSAQICSRVMTFYSRTSDGGNGNHSVSLPIILIKIKVDQVLPSSYISSLLVSIL